MLTYIEIPVLFINAAILASNLPLFKLTSIQKSLHFVVSMLDYIEKILKPRNAFRNDFILVFIGI